MIKTHQELGDNSDDIAVKYKIGADFFQDTGMFSNVAKWQQYGQRAREFGDHTI